MAKRVFTFELRGIKRLAATFRPQLYQQLLRRHVSRATQQNAAFLAGAMRKTIQRGNFDQNAPLTISIKGEGKKPLIDSPNGLFQAITHTKVGPFEAFAGVLRTQDEFNVSVIVHEGKVIEVTPKLRGMFFILWKASQGEIDPSRLTGRAKELFEMNQEWFPLRSDTKAIKIPGRPFVDDTMSNPILARRMRTNWERAMGFVFRDMRRQFFKGGR